MRRNRNLLNVVAALLCLVAVGACSSSTKSGSSATTKGHTTGQTNDSPGSGAQATGAPVKVAFLCSCSGAFGYIGVGARDVYQAWVNTVNAAGGIDGHPVHVTYEDDQLNPGNAMTDAQQAISSGVDAIVDATVFDSVWEKAVDAAKIPVIGTIITSIPFYTDPNFFAEGETNDSLVTALTATIKESGATTFGQIYCAEAPQCQQAVPLIKAAGAKIGLNDTYNTQISATAPNYTAECVAAQQAHVKAVFIGDGAPIIAKVAQNCTEQGYVPTYVIEGNSINSTTMAAPGMKNTLWAQFNYLPYFSTSPAVAAMNAAVDNYYPGLRPNSIDWTQQGAGSWPSGLLLEDAVKGGGLTASQTPSPAEVLQGLYSLKGDTLQGWSPPLTFTPGKPTSVDCWYTGRVQNGVPALVNNGQLTCSNGASS
jgi:branched-chain amino acid transport system substrate-binding protein